MNRVVMKITDNQEIAEKTYFMSLEGDTSAITKPGQFVNIKLDGFFLRRPISVLTPLISSWRSEPHLRSLTFR